MKKKLIYTLTFLCITFSAMCLITSCGHGSSGGNSSGGNSSGGNSGSSGSSTGNIDPSKPSVDKSGKINAGYWGSWKRMDTGATITITDEEVDADEEYDITKFQLESTNVLVYNGNGNPRFFRNRGYARSFTARVAGLSSARAAGEDFDTVNKVLPDVKVSRKNDSNQSDAQESKTDSQGVVQFTGAVADSAQNIKVTRGKTTVELDMEPHYDGEDMGIIPVIEDGSCSFKVGYGTGYNPNIESLDYFYSDHPYNINLYIKNIGDEEISLGYYEISCEDENLYFQAPDPNTLDYQDLSPLSAATGTIEKQGEEGAEKLIKIRLSYSNVVDEYKDVPIKISIKDYGTNREWIDYVTLRFYKRPVYITVAAYNPLSQDNLHGFLISPDGKSQFFDVSSGQSRIIAVPWTADESKKHTLVFSGANANSEMFYAFKVNNIIEGTTWNQTVYDWTLLQNNIPEQMNLIKSFEGKDGNNSEAAASVIEDCCAPTVSYIQKNDIDYFTFNVNTNTAGITASAQQLTDIAVTKTENGRILTFTADTGYTNYCWELDGRVVSTDTTCTIDKSTLAAGLHEVYLQAEKYYDHEGISQLTDSRSASFVFEVK